MKMANPPNVHTGHGNIHHPPKPAHKPHKPPKPVKPAPKPAPVGPPPFNANQAALDAYNSQTRTNQQSDDDLDIGTYAQRQGFEYNPATGQFGGFDPTNPFSQAALLLKSKNDATAASELSYQRGLTGNTNSYASSGQLYSGALQNAQGEQNRLVTQRRSNIQFGYDRGYDTLRSGLLDYVTNYGRRKRNRNLVPPPAPA